MSPIAKRGRPPKFKDEYAGLALHLCRLGATNKDLALALGVSEAAIDRWIAKKPEFAEAVMEGRKLADARVASALYQRAIGASVPDSHVAVINDVVVVTPMVKHYPPDTAACSLWLRNRRPDLWREKTTQAVEITNGDNPYHEAAMRIMEADMGEFQRIYDDEMAKIQAGTPTEIPPDAPSHEESPLHQFVGLGKRTTEIGTRHLAQMIHAADEKHGNREVIEAEIVPNRPALPPESHAEPVSPESPAVTPEPAPTPTPEAATESPESSEDFRALLGLPPRED